MTTAERRPRVLPDGIREEHLRPTNGPRRHASPLALVVFGLVIVLGLTGLLGRERDWRAEAGGVALAVHAPEIIRNGEFLEMRFTVAADTDIADLAIGVGAPLWEDMTVNTMIPAAAEEMSSEDEFRFSFGPLASGGSFELKVDNQVNPDIVGGNEGTVTQYDGDEPLATVDLNITVLP